MDTKLALTRDGKLFTLNLGNDENRFTVAYLREFNRLLDEVETQAGGGPAGLIVTADGKYWSNGIDLDTLGSAPTEDRIAFGPLLCALLGRLVSFPLPTVAALNGHAFAGGAVLALAFDYRVMRTERGWFCLPEIDIQIPFPAPMLSLLRAKLRQDILRDAVLGGKRFTADDMLSARIADVTCELGLLQRTATQLLEPLSLKPRDAYKKFKQDLYGALARELGHDAVSGPPEAE